AQRYVRDPRDVVQVGQVVKVRVLSVDIALQRISLSMKGVRMTPGPAEVPRQEAARRETTAPARRRRKRVVPPPKPPAAPPPETDMAEKLRALQAHFQSPGRS